MKCLILMAVLSTGCVHQETKTMEELAQYAIENCYASIMLIMMEKPDSNMYKILCDGMHMKDEYYYPEHNGEGEDVSGGLQL